MVDSRNYNSSVISTSFIMELVSNVVVRYVCKSCIPKREKEDVEMAIIEKILNQQEKINASFQHKSSIKTYYIAIINRMCCEVIRSESRHWYSVSDVEIEQVANQKTSMIMNGEMQTIIKSEIKRLHRVMLFFNGERAKILIFLKYFFGISIEDDEIKNYAKYNFERVKMLMIQNDSLTQTERFQKMAEIINLVEDKEVKGDAVRMWLNKQIELILKRMNIYNDSNHCKESLKIMMEMTNAYFQNTIMNKELNFRTKKLTKA